MTQPGRPQARGRPGRRRACGPRAGTASGAHVHDHAAVDLARLHLGEDRVDVVERTHRVRGRHLAAREEVQRLRHVLARADDRAADGEAEEHRGEDVEGELLGRQAHQRDRPAPAQRRRASASLSSSTSTAATRRPIATAYCTAMWPSPPMPETRTHSPGFVSVVLRPLYTVTPAHRIGPTAASSTPSGTTG